MSDTIFSVLIEEFKKNGVKVKEHYFQYDNLGKNQTDLISEPSDTKILDFTEHDKVFEDNIARLEKQIKAYEEERKELRMRCCMDSAREKFDNHSYGGLVIYTKNFTSECERRLYDENQELKQRIAELEDKIGDRDEINRCLREQIAELESKGKIELSELPFDPLDTANYLINATYERETNGIERAFQNLPEKVSLDRYTVDELEQIAEHLLIYCRHNKE